MAGALNRPIVPRLFAAVAAAVCWAALALQLYLVTAQAEALGLHWIAGVAAYAAFFTVQSNFLAALATSFTAAGVAVWPARGRIASAIAVYVVTAGIVFLLVLRPVWNHHGPQLLADVLLHYVTPVLYLAFWLMAAPKENLRWRDAVIWLIYPAAYLAAAVAVGAISGFYPYPFLDLPRLGAVKLAFNLASLLGAGLLVGLIVVAAGRAAGLQRRAGFDRRNHAA